MPRLEGVLSRLLTAGTMIAAALAVVGGLMYLASHGGERTVLREFHGEPTGLVTPEAIARGAAGLDARAIMQLAVLVLIATPVLRVAAAGLVFAAGKDWKFVAICGVVLAGLALGLMGWVG